MEEIILGIKVDTSGTQTPIAELESSLNKMKDDIKTLPSDSKAFKVLQDEIRKTDATLKNVNKSLEGLSKEKLSESLGKLVGGASAAVAGFTLLSQSFGATKESAEQMQQSLNIAFGVINGVKGLVEAFTGLSALMPVVTTAMSTFNSVLAANPIGITIAAITLLTGALIAYNSGNEEAIVTQKDFNTSLEQAAESASKYNEKIKEVVSQIDGLQTLLISSGDLSKNTSGLISEVLSDLLKGNKELFDAFSSEIEDTESKIKTALQKRVSELAKTSSDTSKEIEKLTSSLGLLSSIIYEKNPNEQKSILKVLGKSLTEVRAEYDKSNDKLTELLDKNNQINVSEDDVVKQLTEQLKLIQELKKNGLKTDQERTAELEKQKKKQQDIQDEILKYEFIRRENAIRSAQEGIDIIERNKVELLKREEAYQIDLKALKRNENLDAKQKAAAAIVLEKQYALDKLDINQKYLDEKKAQEKKAADEKRAADEAYIKERIDLDKRYVLASAELKVLEAQKDKNDKAGILTAQIEFLDAQRRAELLNTNLTEKEKEVINARYAAKQRELIKGNADFERQQKVQLINDLNTLLGNFYQVYAAMREGDNQKFEQQQTKQLDVFDAGQQQQLALAQNTGENVAATEQRLAAEREQFLADQSNIAKKRRKEDAKAELALMLVTSVANIAAAIIAAQKNQFPLSLEESVRIAALGVTQIATLAAQVNKINEIETYGNGGVVSGPSHENGGVQYGSGGQVRELEGGEGVISKRSMRLPGVAQAASYLNQLGGGVAFNNSTIKGQTSSIATLSAMVASQSNNEDRLIRAYVVETDISSKQVINNKIRNRAKF